MYSKKKEGNDKCYGTLKIIITECVLLEYCNITV